MWSSIRNPVYQVTPPLWCFIIHVIVWHYIDYHHSSQRHDYMWYTSRTFSGLLLTDVMYTRDLSAFTRVLLTRSTNRHAPRWTDQSLTHHAVDDGDWARVDCPFVVRVIIPSEGINTSGRQYKNGETIIWNTLTQSSKVLCANPPLAHTHTYTYTHIQTYTHIHTRIHTYTHTYIPCKPTWWFW